MARFLFFGILLFQLASTATEIPQQWLRLYHSDVISDRFYFSPNGRVDPRAEWEAALLAFEDTYKTYGTLKLPAACAFPARKLVLERLLQKKFSPVQCPDVENWLERINADQVSIVYAGAYAGNPASTLGHTFLRLSHSATSGSNRPGADLLSYSVGFLAQTDPNDNRLSYMLKGLTGMYPAYFEIEPHYMKVGLYNNSESRDLWEVPLNLKPEEVHLLLLHLWELTFNAQFKYYFTSKNCSYRLVGLIEAVRPDLEISKNFGPIVVPAETIRKLQDAHLGQDKLYYRASVKRRMKSKTSTFAPEDWRTYKRARSSEQETMSVQNPIVMDVLLDHWLLENYKLQTKLSVADERIMNATYLRVSQLSKLVPFSNPSNEEIRSQFDLSPPFHGHHPAWIELASGKNRDYPTYVFTYRQGVHPFWSPDKSYEDLTSIEYLGVNLRHEESSNTHWSLLIIDARSFEGLEETSNNISWQFDSKLGNTLLLNEANKPELQINGGVGVSSKNGSHLVYFLAHIANSIWHDNSISAQMAPGFLTGWKIANSNFSLITEADIHWWKQIKRVNLTVRISQALNLNETLSAQAGLSEYTDKSTDLQGMISWVHFF